VKKAVALAGLAVASLALGELSKYKDWAKSPEAYFLTGAERQEWSNVKTDEEAERFVSLYWVKRDPTPATPENEFREAVMRRIAAADEQFKMRRQRGSESARGRIFVTLGSPSRVSRSGGPESEEQPPNAGPGSINKRGTDSPFTPSGPVGATQTWTYDKDRFDSSWGIGELRARFSVDAQRGVDALENRSEVDRAVAKIAEKSIVNPGAMASPVAAAAGGPPAAGVGAAAQNVPAAPPAAPVTATLSSATRSALEALVKGKKEEASAVFWGGSFRSIPGEVFYAFQLYVPADKAPPAPVKFGGIVMSDSGAEAASFWEDARLSDMKTGEKTDKVFERSVVLPPGSYQAAFGLFPAEEGTAIVSASARFKLEQNGSEFGVSPLILGDTLTPLTKRPSPTDPFVFGAEKPIRVEPKANHLFARGDSLWYFYTVSNPVLVPVPAATQAAAETKGGHLATAPPSASPATAAAGSSTEAPAPTPEPVKPRILMRIGVLKDGRPAFRPFAGPAELQMLGPGYYASGSEIPLASFESGYYTFTLNVRDLNAPKDSAANRGIDRQGNFVVLNPDGSLPEKPASRPGVKPGSASP
jgi:GWxTD domain-containing protein